MTYYELWTDIDTLKLLVGLLVFFIVCLVFVLIGQYLELEYHRENQIVQLKETEVKIKKEREERERKELVNEVAHTVIVQLKDREKI